MYANIYILLFFFIFGIRSFNKGPNSTPLSSHIFHRWGEHKLEMCLPSMEVPLPAIMETSYNPPVTVVTYSLLLSCISS